jgi:hypothetical protein
LCSRRITRKRIKRRENIEAKKERKGRDEEEGNVGEKEGSKGGCNGGGRVCTVGVKEEK